MAAIEFRKAIWEALDEELARDERVFFYGEDVAAAGGVFAVTGGLVDRHGERVFDTPISELALAGAAYGSAITGSRPVLEIMFGDFLPLVADMLINQATKYWYLNEGRTPVPIVIRGAYGAGGRFGAIHSQSPIGWFTGVPGLKIVTPSTPADAKGLLKTAIRDDNPVHLPRAQTALHDRRRGSRRRGARSVRRSRDQARRNGRDGGGVVPQT